MVDFKLIKFELVGSTQDEAKAKCGTLREGTVIVSRRQTKGRGKPGTVWFSPNGGLYFSVVLKPQKPVLDLLLVTKLTADAVVELLSKYKIQADVKLPNDVMADGKKICGILTEKTKGALIIGIGLNVNHDEFAGLEATSMRLLKGTLYNIEDVLMEFLEIFNDKYSKVI